MTEKLSKYIAIALFVGIVVFMVKMYLDKEALKDRVADLHNEIAQTSKTIEIQKGVFQKATSELSDLEEILDSIARGSKQDREKIEKLMKELDKRNEDILNVTRFALMWRKPYEGEAEANQLVVPPEKEGDPERKKVEFQKDFGYIGVNGFTLTDPAYSWVKVEQKRPLKVTLALSQDKRGRWNTYATTSEDNVAVDIEVASVNPKVLDKKWYEKISVDTSLGVGSGIVASAGLSYDFGSFSLGPAVFTAVGDGRGDVYWGANFGWRPFHN